MVYFDRGGDKLIILWDPVSRTKTCFNTVEPLIMHTSVMQMSVYSRTLQLVLKIPIYIFLFDFIMCSGVCVKEFQLHLHEVLGE